MIGILGGMGTQAGLDFCNKLAILYRGKIDQDYPLFMLYNKSNIPGRPESIGIHTGKLSNKISNKKTGEVYKDEDDWKAKGVPEEDIKRDVTVIMPSLDLFPKTK